MKRGARRLILDLTPLIDTIMILLFGVLINSFERTTRDTTVAKGTAAQAERVAEEVNAENARLRDELAQAKRRLAQSESNRLKDQAELANWIRKLIALAGARAKDSIDRDTAPNLAELRQGAENTDAAFQALRRINEMEKVFTFVDLHLDGSDFLAVSVNMKPLGKIPVRGVGSPQIEQELRRLLESVNYNQMVLFLFSYTSDARVLSMQHAEEAINTLIDQYRQRGNSENRQYRYASVGPLDTLGHQREGSGR
ncbi:MAG: hypothetical protein U1D30_17650 [Planctomycetota bacterium]